MNYESLPHDPRLFDYLAQAGIPHVLAAVVELVTNSDDSYRRLGHYGVPAPISIEVWRKNGNLERIAVTDMAEGMTESEMWAAITYGGETSGFEKGKRVRGLFGRGLKDVLLALGHGNLESIKDGRLIQAEVDYKGHHGKAGARRPTASGCSPEVRNRLGIAFGNGTRVSATMTREKKSFVCPAYKTLKKQVSSYYALRDINSDPTRSVRLTVYDNGKKESIGIKYIYPSRDRKVIDDRKLSVKGFQQAVTLSLYECSSPLETCRNNPFGESALIIRTEGVIVDQTFFDYESDDAASYFWGEIDVPEIAARLRSGDYSILTPSRIGLTKRTEFYENLKQVVEREIAPFIEAKKSALKRPTKEVGEGLRRKNRQVLTQLNQIYKELLEKEPEKGSIPKEIIQLTVAPQKVNVEIGRQRQVGVYLPANLAPTDYKLTPVSVSSDNPGVTVVSPKVFFKPHPERHTLLYTSFTLGGKSEGARAIVTVEFMGKKANCFARVAPLSKKRKGKPRGVAGRFRDILPELREPPVKRVDYAEDTGVITIVVNNPAVAPFLREGLDGADTPQGAMLLAELIGQIVCRVLVKDRIDEGKLFLDPDDDPMQTIEAYDTFLDDIHNPQDEDYKEVMKLLQEMYVLPTISGAKYRKRSR